MTTVALKDVTKVFPDGTVAVDSVSLDVNDGEFMVLLGPSGLRQVHRAAHGRRPGGPDHRRDPARRRARPTTCPRASAGSPWSSRTSRSTRTCRSATTSASRCGCPGSSRCRAASGSADVASALGIGDVLARKPSQLSGGQRQRVAMGRAIVRRPGLFLMDEPLSNLDSGLRAELRAEISGLVRELGVTTIYVTHDQAEALTMADRVAIMRRGVLQDVGTPTQVYGRPATLYVAAFLGSPRMNLLEASVYVHLDRYVALQPRRPGALPALGRHPGAGRSRTTTASASWSACGPRRSPRSRPDTPGRRAARPDPLPGAPRPRVAGVPRHRRDRGRGRRDGPAPAEQADERRPGLRRFGARGAAAHRPRQPARAVQRGTGSARSRTSVLSDPGRHHRRPAELAVRLAPYPDVSAPGTRWPSRCGWTRCTSSTSAATASTWGGADRAQPCV